VSAERLDRKVTVILATDVAAYSKHVEQDESLTIKTYSEREAVLLDLIKDFHGRVFNTGGDSVLAEFASAVDAVECAAAFQLRMVEINSRPDTRCKLEFRIGINMGDVVQKDGNLLGDGVNIAARLEALSQPNGVSVSKSIHDLVAPKTNLTFDDLGTQKIKKNEFHAFDVMMQHSKRRAKSRLARSSLMLGGGVLGLALLILAIVGLGPYHLIGPDRKFQPLDKDKLVFQIPDTPSITVTPFKNLVPDPSTDYLKTAIVDNINSVLTGSPELFVSAGGATQPFVAGDTDVRAVAEATGVRYVLAGNYQVVGEHIRITSRLNDALNGTVLWSGKFDDKIDNLFGILDDISATIFEEVHVKVTGKNRSQLAFFKTNEDFTAYLNCLDLFQYYTRDKNKQTETCIKSLGDHAQQTPPARMLHAWAYWQRVFIGASDQVESDIAFARDIALRMKDKIETGEPLVLNAWLDFLEGKYDSVAKNARQAIEVDPSNSEIIPIAASLLRRIGKYEEARTAFDRTLRMNPYPSLWVPREYATTLIALEAYPESKALLERNLPRVTREGQRAPIMVDLAVIAVLEGNVTEGRRICEEAKSETARFDLNGILSTRGGTTDKAFLDKFRATAYRACE